MTTLRRTSHIATEPTAEFTSDLRCPSCNGTHLHHQSVSVFDRGEDAPTVRKTLIGIKDIGISTVDHETSGNPSRRRDGVVIDFTCETCDASPIQLTLAQHKGNTEIGWRFGPATNA